ncbi:hypothetical protein [Methanosarcina sp.]|uniref:hypothetical protein n=1 Tax=Methanosarcina sp. TaxID=2213 RepID=UPI002B6D6D7B|nr:hypothetical protein [Methanosarcina sp.]HOW13211.1 hypothetical protein [Methanosarcina sp.]
MKQTAGSRGGTRDGQPLGVYPLSASVDSWMIYYTSPKSSPLERSEKDTALPRRNSGWAALCSSLRSSFGLIILSTPFPEI